QLENDRLILGLDKNMMDLPMLLARNRMGSHHVKWTKDGDYILLSISLIPSKTGVLIPPLYKNQRIDYQILGRFPIIKDKSTEHTFFIDATDLFLKTFIRWDSHIEETVV